MKNGIKVKFAIVGCGRIAKRHAEHIKQIGTLLAVCDIDKERAMDLGKDYDAAVYFDIDVLLRNEKNCDVISICSPNGWHAEHSIKALNSGFHVICEKPMALTVEDCGRMIDTSFRVNKRLFIVKQNRFNPPVEILKNIIEEDKLGKIFSIQLNCFWNRNPDYYHNSNWKGTKNLDGGTLFTQFSHFIDLIYWLIGDVKEVFAFTDNFGHHDIIEFEDTGVIALKFSNGVLGSINYNVNAFNKNMEGSLTVFGEKGTVKIGGQYLNELEYQSIKDYEIRNVPKGNGPNNYGEYSGSMSNHDKVYQNVIDVIENEGSIATNAYEGLKTVEIIDKIYRSALKNKYSRERIYEVQ
ncbi:MAG: Gfo/Idh/MocA family oxidoreductase [Bacteroidales bacterium]|nr:Gfo/Idh/MocA family oxidoreductase [Bacteroidales bacterium]